VTFGDDKKDKVLGTGIIKVNNCFTLNDVALVDRLRYNLLSISQLCDADLSVLFRKSDSHALDSSAKRVCGISRIGNIFQADFSSAQSSLRCLISQSYFELWKWHRRLGHLSFDLLCRLSGLGLLRGLPLLKFESDLVCAPCHHGKMIATSHSPVNTIMTKHSGQLFHIDTVGPSRVRSMGGKWYVLKCGNLDKFESRSFDAILLGYTPHGRSYRVYNFETNTIVESCDVTFDETAPCPRGIIECVFDKEIEESIFIDEGL
jgi:hypothetical protein